MAKLRASLGSKQASARSTGTKARPASRSSKLPSPTRERLLAAALKEFGEKGFEGARVDRITRDANANKQLVYHYFGNKEGLFQSVLERAYAQYSENVLRAAVSGADATTALRSFIDHMFRPSVATLYFNQILQDENRFAARHVKRLTSVKQTYVRLMALIEEILAQGEREGVFRGGIDPREFYVSLVGMFNLRTANTKTLSAALGLPLESPAGMARSREAALKMILNGIGARPQSASAGRSRRSLHGPDSRPAKVVAIGEIGRSSAGNAKPARRNGRSL